jgi:oxygen-dependent protoporphyrinogen oxidase
MNSNDSFDDTAHRFVPTERQIPITLNAAEPDIIIVGAGIAGLTAAYFLSQNGISVRVIEADTRVGGRMTSDVVNGHVVDRGAQFLSSEYSLILDMLRRLGLEQQCCTTSQCSAIVRDGTPRNMRIDHPLDSLKLLSLYGMLRLAWHTLRFHRKQTKLSLSDYSQWAAFDTESAAAWSNGHMANEVAEYMVEPMLHGFYFQTPEETSKALAVALTAFGMRRAKTISLKEGLGILPEGLARGMDVMLNTSVQSIELVDGQACVHTASGNFIARHVILAVPAPVAKKLLVDSSDQSMASLLATPYSASINVACVTDAHFTLPENLNTAYGLLIPRNERATVAAVGIENNKNRGGDVGGQLLNMMLSHDAAVRLMSSSDEDIVASAMQSVANYFPSLAAHAVHSRIYRWPLAEPLSSVGRSTQLQAYRQRCKEQLPTIILAGDYMSMPYTEGAAESGYWAAAMVTRRAAVQS